MMVFSSTWASICSTSMQYLPGDMGISRISMSQYLANLCHTTWTGPHTMLGLSVDLPAASRLARQRHLAAMPPSMQASDEPMAEHPTALALLGGVPQVGQHLDAPPLDLGRLGVLVLVDHVLVDATGPSAGGPRAPPRSGRRWPGSGGRCRRAAARRRCLERVLGPHLVLREHVRTAGRSAGPCRRRPSRAARHGWIRACAGACGSTPRLVAVRWIGASVDSAGPAFVGRPRCARGRLRHRIDGVDPAGRRWPGSGLRSPARSGRRTSGELAHGPVEPVAGAEVGAHGDGVARAGVGPGQGPPAHLGVDPERLGGHVSRRRPTASSPTAGAGRSRG